MSADEYELLYEYEQAKWEEFLQTHSNWMPQAKHTVTQSSHSTYLKNTEGIKAAESSIKINFK